MSTIRNEGNFLAEHAPLPDNLELAPIVLFVHGGGFIAGHLFSAIRYAAPPAKWGYVLSWVNRVSALESGRRAF